MMTDQPLQTILSIIGSTGALVAVILICGFSINLVRLNYRQRDVLEHISTGRERYLLSGAAFILFIAFVLVIGIGILSNTLKVAVGDILGLALLALPVWLNEYLLQRRSLLRRRYALFVAYVTGGTILILLSVGARLVTDDWSTLIGALSNAAFVGVQLILFAIGWGVTVPSGRYEVDLKLEGGETITGHWIAQSGDEFVVQVENTIVAVRAAKVVSRTFRDV